MTRILYCIIILCLSACGVEHDELWREKIELPNGSHCFVYHSFDCPNKKPILLCTEKKYEYRKMKHDVFDYCISEDEIQILNLISNKNIREALESSIDYGDYNFYIEMKNIYDLSNRGHILYYSINNESNLQELEKPMSGFSLIELYGNK